MNGEKSFELIDNEVKVKIDKEIFTLKPDIIEKLTMNEQSFFKGAKDFYNNDTACEKKPIDLTSAPYAHRFNDLIDFLKIGFTDDHSLCNYPKSNELFELIEYLGILPEDSLDHIVKKRRLEPPAENYQKDEQLLFEMGRTFFLHLNDEDEEPRFTFAIETNGLIRLFKKKTYEDPLCRVKLNNLPLENAIVKIKEILNARLRYMNYATIWKNEISSSCICLTLSLHSVYYLQKLYGLNFEIKSS